MVNLRSDTTPTSPRHAGPRARSRMDCRVTPGRIVPSVSGAVTSSRWPSSLTQCTKKFMVPTSVTSRASPNSHSTCE